MRRNVIGMISSYADMATGKSLSQSQSDWLWHQTPRPFGEWGTIQMMANAPEPDFLLLYQFNFPLPPRNKSLKSRVADLWRKPSPPPPDVQTLFRGVPKERRIFLLREPPLPEVVEANKANYEQAKLYCGYISGPDDFAPTPDYMPAIWYLSNSFRELNDMGVPEKLKACSWMTSGIDRSLNHRRRLEFIRLLQERGVNFDLYGRGLPAWARSYGALNQKWHALAPYYYNLAIENYAENDWYVSEKLWDALLAWCLPIYYGGSAADKLLPPGSFLRLPSLDEKGLSYIQEVISTPDCWHEAKSAIAEARQIVLHKLNLLNWLSEFVAQFS